MPDLICPAIIVPDWTVAVEDLTEQLVCDFVFWAEDSAFLVPGEYPHEARLAFYLTRVFLGDWMNGSFSQVASNNHYKQEFRPLVSEALGRVACEDCIAIWVEFTEATDLWLAEHGDGAWDDGDIDDPPEWAALDTRLAEAGCFGRLLNATAAWLEGLPVWRPLPPEQLKAEQTAVIARNPNFAERQTARFGPGRSSLLNTVGEQLCQKAGLLAFSVNPYFSGATPDGATAWAVTTDEGTRIMHLRDRAASLCMPDSNDPIASVTWS